MFERNQLITGLLPFFFLLTLGACTSQESRNLKIYTDAEMASRAERGTFLEHYKNLRSTSFTQQKTPEIIAMTKAMKDAQNRRLETLEKLAIKETKLRTIHGNLLQAERTILNAILAFEGLMEGENIGERQYRTNLSTLEEAVNNGEPLFTAYESELENYKVALGKN